jgi:flagella basal body P-ring formation protein FlgA
MKNATTTILLAVASAWFAAASAVADSVTLRPSARVAVGAAVKLEDIADLDGDAARKFGHVTVGRGDSGAFEISLDKVRQSLVVAGADVARLKLVGTTTIVRPLRAATTTTVVSPAPTVVANAQAVIPPAPTVTAPTAVPATIPTLPASADGMRMIDPALLAGTTTPLAIICEMMHNAFGAKACGLRLEITDAHLAKLAPVTGMRYEVAAKTTLRSERVEFEVTAHGPDGAAKRERVRLIPRLEREVLVTTVDAKRGTHVDPRTTAVETRILSLDEADDAIAPGSLVDATITRTLPRGSIVGQGDTSRNVEIHRNDKVIVRHEVGTVAIEFDAIAIEDGAVGDVIALERGSKHRARGASPLSAEIVGPGRAVIR